MRFTQSVDGTARAAVRLELRFTACELALIKVLAQRDGSTWRQWLTRAAWEGVDARVLRHDGEDESSSRT